MKTSTTILCILLPVLLTLYVRQPEVFSLDMGISGTSDVLAIPLLLPKAQVLALLPPHIRDESALIVPTTEELEALFGAKALQSTAESTGGALHPVFIQLARQHATGLGPNWLPKMTFGEAKLEVPYVRHPALRQDISTEKKDAPFVFKQTM